MTSVPALALSAAQFVIPLIIMAFSHDTALFTGMKIAKHMTSFPSDNTLRKYTLHQAARDTMTLGAIVANKYIYLACDKGNKKGVGHFIKMLSCWNSEAGKVDVRLLDIDALGGTSADCAKAMQSSMKKLAGNNGIPLLSGQVTDSGGGGVLDSLADEMRLLALLKPKEEHLIANCCIHAAQLMLRNAIYAALGDGGLGNINAMQMLHSVYDLQESLELEEWRHVLCLSNDYVVSFTNNAVDSDTRLTAAQRNKNDFEEACTKMLTFHTKFKTTPFDLEATKLKGTILAVGSAARIP